MEPPVILIADWSEVPPITLIYIKGKHELHLESLYTAIKSLSTHPGRGFSSICGTPTQPDRPGHACSGVFLNHFWNLFACIIDYVADFAIHDNAVTQSVWFHLVDVLQVEASKLPHEFWTPGLRICTHARVFMLEFEQSLQLFCHMVTGIKVPSPSMDKLIRPTFPMGDNLVFCGSGWKTGLKPWQQFLYNESPGFDVPEADRVLVEDDGFSRYLEGKEIVKRQHVPLGALAIVHKHTERSRNIAKRLALDRGEERDEETILEEFDQHALKISGSFSYPSLHGRTAYVQHMYPGPLHNGTPIRYSGYADPSNIDEHPDLYLLDECVGDHKGHDAFMHPYGDEFHMWTVTTLREQAPPGEADASAAPLGDLTDMFDDWTYKEGETKSYVPKVINP
ncbi:hypothetical protein K505DRAFT_373466 [Melanomma pulvis-pyrius CBS 109.77]|uniref:Uncharacterized protein n=1 Tax=Melanomma pulvis-pyrius CBS 109.77 TaxID=1314802 RepID=A0A6A6XHV6_9PLEO|nr:hypothetical protein K505DRAFT_373466 [Melanomma pulvis-pyrius CBS 109.77]